MKSGHNMDSVELRQTLHSVPEKSFAEYRTKEILEDWLRKHTDFMVIDGEGWFYAVKKGGARPPVAFRADMDAVCGSDGRMGHYCGHDGHCAILAGLAERLRGRELPGDIYLIFQPAEETGAGAMLCRTLIREKRIAEIFGLHNIPGYQKGSVLLRKGTFACGSTGLRIRLTGAVSHAAYPEKGNNPGVSLAKLLLYADTRAREIGQQEFLMMTVIGADIGSSAYGVSAGTGEIRMTIRAEREAVFRSFLTELKAKSEEYARNGGFSLAWEEIEYFPATENYSASVDRVREAALQAGLSVQELSEPMRWSEDFGYYLQETAGAFFGIGDGETYPQLHTSAFSFPDDILEPAVRLLERLAFGNE